MISLSTIQGDSDGNIVIEEKLGTGRYDAQARIARTATLDGGVAFDHRGYAAGDQTINFDCIISQAEEDILKSLFEDNTLIYLSCKDGFFSGAIQKLTIDKGAAKIAFLISETA